MEFLQPPDWPRPKGYSNGVAAKGTMVFVAGEIGWNPVTEKVELTEFADQTRQALENVVAVLAQAGAKPEHVTDKQEYLSNLRGIGEAYRAVIGKHFPVMAAIEVKGLMEPGAKLEIEATAVIPD
jgi:enamine deaminase RidA (YjgF/YER057c/UK114 family)